MTTIEKFMRHVEPEPNSGCWLWVGTWARGGYGRFHVERKPVAAHRMSHEMFKGPTGVRDVLHRCDTPPCVNPDHLFLGTDSDNHADSARKGRRSRGSRHWRTALTDDAVRVIRHLRATGATLSQLAHEFSVSVSVVCDLCTRRTWKHVQ